MLLVAVNKIMRGRATCCGQQATCCTQHVAHPRNLLPRNMLRWCKRDLKEQLRCNITFASREFPATLQQPMMLQRSWEFP